MAGRSFRVNRPNVAAETVDGEVLMIHLGTGNYYSLRGTGAAIWEAIELAVPRSAVVSGLREHFNGDAQGQDTDAVVDAFLAELAGEDLIVPDDAPDDAPDDSWDPSSCGPGSEPPELEKFTDMQHLILLDPVHEVDETEGWPKLRSDP